MSQQLYILNAWFSYHFCITFQALSSYINIFEILRSQFFSDRDLVQYVKYHCHVTLDYFEK